jgi:hypothetical protein
MAASPLAAQLRPIEPVPWDAVDAQGPMARVGVGVHDDARATLAGTIGTLTELGIYTGTWTTGRVVIEIGGVVTRLFSDDSVYAAPIAHAHPSDGSRRVDTGEHRFATTVLLTPDGGPVAAVMRFGTRLPTTENEEGLGRDQTDFFGGFGARARRGALEAAGEVGLGILSTRLDRPEQVDVLTYGARLGTARPGARGWIEAVGQHDTRRAAELRGLEDLSEARLVGEIGARRRIRATLVRGLTDASVGWGVVLEGAARF